MKINKTSAFLAVIGVLSLMGGTAYATNKIDGASIKVHSIPGNRLAKNATVPNAKTLGGHSDTAFAPASRAQATGYIAIPAGGKPVTLLVRKPLTWSATCVVTGAANAIVLSVKASEAANIGANSGTSSTALAAGGSSVIDNFITDQPFNSTLYYNVLGADHTTYSGDFTLYFGLFGKPCGAAITASG
jgi:hypothetical protein